MKNKLQKQIKVTNQKTIKIQLKNKSKNNTEYQFRENE